MRLRSIKQSKGGERMSESSVDAERMKLCYMEFATEKTDGVDVIRKSSTIRGDTLQSCLEYTTMLHKGDIK